MEEIWKDIYYVDNINNEIIDYRGLYQISNLGRIKSLNNKKSKNQYKKERILKPYINNNERYMTIFLCKNGKRRKFRIHRLVAEMFIPNPNNLLEVNHINENKLDNNIYNLEWCTPSYNVNHGTRNKRVANKLAKKVIGINKNNTKVIILKSTRQGDKFGFNSSHISGCCNGKRKSHKGYKWYYLDDYLNMATLSEADLETSGTCND